MDKYTFNHSGDKLLELVTLAISAADEHSARMFFDPKYSLMSIRGGILSGRVYSSKEEYIDLANRVIRREPDTISDVQKIINILQDKNDMNGQKALFDILKGIDKNKIAKDVRDFEVGRIYSHFLYNKGYAISGFRVNNPEINKTLLMRLLELGRPEKDDFKMLVENAEALGVTDEEIEKNYNMLKHKYESAGTYVNGQLQEQGNIDQITQLFNPVKERIEAKKQQQERQPEEGASEEKMPDTLEKAWEEIRRLRRALKDSQTQNDMLRGQLQIQKMQPENTNGGVNIQPEQVKAI